MPAKRLELAGIACILIFGAAVRLPLIDRPFQRDPEGCGSFFGILARNYWRYHFHQTLGVPVLSMGIVERPTLYPNHPPLVPLLIAGMFGIAGYTDDSNPSPPDWMVRFPTTLSTLGCIFCIWWILRSNAAPRAALLAAGIFAAVPMTLVFGGQVDVIATQLVVFVLLTLIAYIRFHRQPSIKNLILIAAAFTPAALTDWPAFFAVPVLAVHFAITHSVRRWWWIFTFAAYAALLFAALYLHGVLATGDWQWMVALLQKRTFSNVSDRDFTFTFIDWIQGAILGHAVRRHTWPVMLAAMGWIIWSLVRHDNRHRAALPAALLLAWATLHVLVGRQGVFVHEWWWWPLTPGVAMAAGLFIDRALRTLRARPMQHRIATVFTIVLLALFAAWNSRSAFAELSNPSRISSGEFDYSLVEIGNAIREATLPNELILLAESDQSLPLWYYVDRPFRYRIWDPHEFERRLADDCSDLCFNLTEQNKSQPRVCLIPRAYLPVVPRLHDYLRSRYPLRESHKFLIFDLQPTVNERKKNPGHR